MTVGILSRENVFINPFSKRSVSSRVVHIYNSTVFPIPVARDESAVDVPASLQKRASRTGLCCSNFPTVVSLASVIFKKYSYFCCVFTCLLLLAAQRTYMIRYVVASPYIAYEYVLLYSSTTAVPLVRTSVYVYEGFPSGIVGYLKSRGCCKLIITENTADVRS